MRIRFVFCYNISWYAILSPVISYFEKLKRVSHFAIVIDNDFGQSWVYESVWPRTRKIKFQEWSKKYEIYKVYNFDVPNHKRYLIFEWLEAQRNKAYPFSQLIFILVSILNKGFEKISKRWVLNGSKWLICTELGSRFVSQFFVGIINESHDRIGLNDMLKISSQYESFKDIWRE